MRAASLRFVRVGAACAVAALAALVVAPAASAHTLLEASDPPDGSSLVASPRTATLIYSEDIELGLTAVTVEDGAGHLVGTSTRADPRRATALIVDLPVLGRGLYQLRWRVTDREDLHQSDGVVVFGVGTTPTAALAHQTTRPPDVTEVVLKVASRGGLTLLLGALCVVFGVLPRVDRNSRRAWAVPLRRAMMTVGAGGLGVAILADTALLVIQARRAGPVGATVWHLVANDPVGRSWLVEAALGVPVALALLALRHDQLRQDQRRRSAGRSRGLEASAALGALVIAGAVALAGHAGGAPHPTVWATSLRAGHLVAIGAWLGGLACVTWCLTRLRGLSSPGLAVDTETRDGARELIGAYSSIAAVGMAVIVITGLALSGREVASVTALLSTWYGAILVAKVALLALVAVLGIRHARRVRSGRRNARPLTLRSLRLELGGGAAILALGAALSATAPALGPQYDRPLATVPPAASAQTADLVVRTTLAPNRPGLDLASVNVLNTRRPVPGVVTAVTMILTRPGSPTLRRRAQPGPDGAWSAGEVELTKGPMTVEVDVQRAGLADNRTTMAWTVNDYARWVRPTVLSSAPWGPIADRLAWAAVAVSGALVLLARYRRGGQRPTTTNSREAPLSAQGPVGVATTMSSIRAPKRPSR